MKRLLLITTGGTIACTEHSDGLSPTMEGAQILEYVPQATLMASLDVLSILSIDSSNMQPEHWVKLAETIHLHDADYDGFVLLHGTDTMAYTTSALSFMTLGIEKPIIFTGAQLPIHLIHSDGRKNLCDAIHVACNGGLQGVYLVFHGRIMSGCCVSKIDSVHLDAFQSMNNLDVGSVANGKISIFSPPRQWERTPHWHSSVDPRVLLWKLTPGLSPDVFDDSIYSSYKIVVLEAFGIGGLPTLKNSFLSKILEWNRRGILTVVTTQCHQGGCDMSIYEVGRLALNKGAVCAGNMTREALLTKLMWLLSMTEDFHDIIQMLRKDYCGEFGS